MPGQYSIRGHDRYQESTAKPSLRSKQEVMLDRTPERAKIAGGGMCVLSSPRFWHAMIYQGQFDRDTSFSFQQLY